MPLRKSFVFSLFRKPAVIFSRIVGKRKKKRDKLNRVTSAVETMTTTTTVFFINQSESTTWTRIDVKRHEGVDDGEIGTTEESASKTRLSSGRSEGCARQRNPLPAQSTETCSLVHTPFRTCKTYYVTIGTRRHVYKQVQVYGRSDRRERAGAGG